MDRRDHRLGLRRRLVAVVVAMSAATALCGGCEQPTHDNIDHWLRTARGPDKLREALADSTLAADLRAHAAQNLIARNELADVVATFEAMAGPERASVLAVLAPRLWADARISGALTKPTAEQTEAKDALFELRRFAEAAECELIDGYLIDWLTGGYYVGRARAGRVLGPTILRAVGPAASPKMQTAVAAVVDAPARADGSRLAIEGELLVGLAATGSPEAVGYLLELVDRGDRDPELPQRAMRALYTAFVDPGQRFPPAPGQALVPHLGALSARALDRDLSTAMQDDLIALIAAAGPPGCITALVPLVGARRQPEMVRWVSANAALRCGRAQALVPVAEALPPQAEYDAGKLAGVIWEPMEALAEPEVVAAQARLLLGSESWVARVIGVELLGRVAAPGSAAEDAQRVRALGRDRTVLRGWWGDQRDLPRAQRRPLPRLGDRARDVADRLDRLAKSRRKT
ncbi:hypothetical protein [Haliangium sp.]|uniref:hypothetical protein n=2 Tax=Haliangium sp. TaxID=2663208 RepID=UPI003D0EFAA4